jgi:RNA polymerase sigma-70 factor, ECF subfamily
LIQLQTKTQSPPALRLVEGRKTATVIEREVFLINRIAGRDEVALQELYKLYYSRLHRFASQINTGFALDEIINDVMYVVWQKADTFDGSSLPSTWIFGIAYNKARQALRAMHHVKNATESLDDTVEDCAHLGFENLDLKQLENLELLEEAFAEALSTEQRTVVELTYFQGMSYKEIAKIMSCSENTVKTRMFHARIKLAKHIGKQNLFVDDFNP